MPVAIPSEGEASDQKQKPTYSGLWIEHLFDTIDRMSAAYERAEGHRDGAIDSLLSLCSGDVADLTDGEVTEAVIELAELSGRVTAALARFTSSFDSRALHAVDGAWTTASWMAARTEMARPVASITVVVGRGLRQAPHVDAAAANGRLGAAKVRMLLDARDRVEDLFAQHEERLVADVVLLTVEQARRYIDAWRAVALASVTGDDDPAPGDDSDLNGVHLSSTFQNRWRLDGDLDDLTGEALANALDSWVDARVREGVIDPGELKRSQMRAMALAALVGLGHEASSPRAQRRADVHITWDADDMLGKPVADMVELARRRCMTDRGTHLSRLAASEALCNADVTDLLVRFDLDGTSTVLGATHTRRHPTDRERAVLAERDRGCTFPGCDAPVAWCDAHHTVPYEIGRRTQLDELVLLCPHHHRQVHRGFTLTRSITGQIRVARPDGTRLDAGSEWDAHPVNPRHKLPPPTRFAASTNAGGTREGPGSVAEASEPYDPVYEAEVDAAIRRRFDELMDNRAA